MKNTLRGRPKLNLELSDILEAIRRHGQVLAAAREIGCSDAYVHVRLKDAGLTLAKVLDIRNAEALLNGKTEGLLK